MKFVKVIKANNLSKEDIKLAEKYFVECVNDAILDAENEDGLGDYNDIKEKVRNLHSNDEISDLQYDYILEHWDDILKRNNL